MKKENFLLIFSCLCIIVCIPGIYFLNYEDIAAIILVVLILCDLALYMMNRIELKYKFIKKKALIYADISNFRLIKLFYGNDKKIVKKVLNIIRKNAKNGCVSRVNSNHFLILLPYKNRNELISFANKVNNEVKDIINDDIFNLSLKFGIHICDEGNFDADVTKASFACNKAKVEALSTYCFYEEEEAENQINEKKTIDKLVNALKNHEFEVYYQPKYDYKSNKIVGSEALVRLIEDGKVVPAKDFIDVAEKYGFTVMLDKFVLKEVCKKIKDLKKNNVKFNLIGVNVSRNTLCEKSMIDYYSSILDQYGVKKTEIELEVTERDPNNTNYSLTKTIHELSKAFNVSVDDFGIGNSSLYMLKENKINTIKIDRKFVIDETESGRKILSSIIRLARELGFNLVAEGVETEEQYKFLKSKGCHVMQGFYYSKPLTFDELESKLKEVNK